MQNIEIMVYQKIWIFLGNTNNQPSKFRRKNQVEMNDMGGESTTQLVKLN